MVYPGMSDIVIVPGARGFATATKFETAFAI
jgi:hypothetical protein